MRTPEQEAALRSIRKLMDFWGIDPEELGLKKSVAKVTAPTAVKERVAPTLKYRHPVSGVTWDGEGSQPEWLRFALTHEGYTVDALRIQSVSSAIKDT